MFSLAAMETNKGISNCSNEIHVEVKDFVLTPLACATLINEIFKVIMYQKSQIPYPYNWLKHAVKSKRESGELDEKKPNNFTLEKSFRVASTAYDIIENTMKSICTEFKACSQDINEILILLGPIPALPTEVFTIRVPALSNDHSERNHWATSSRNQHKVLRDICLSEDWNRAMQSSVPATNVYVMIQKYLRSPELLDKGSDFFIPKRNYELPPNVRNTIIHLISNNDAFNCCDNLSIYEDSVEEQSSDIRNTSHEISTESTNSQYLWFQAKDFMKGFKDCFVNRKSVSDLW